MKLLHSSGVLSEIDEAVRDGSVDDLRVPAEFSQDMNGLGGAGVNTSASNEPPNNLFESTVYYVTRD